MIWDSQGPKLTYGDVIMTYEYHNLHRTPNGTKLPQILKY